MRGPVRFNFDRATIGHAPMILGLWDLWFAGTFLEVPVFHVRSFANAPPAA